MARTIADDYEQKRNAILGHSAKIFARVGYDRASMNEVAKACGISKAALYHYFPSKNSVLYSILENHLQGLKDHITTLKKLNRNEKAFLAYIVEEILVFYQGNDDIHELQIHAIGQLDKSDQDALKRIMRELVGFVSKQIKNVSPNGFKDDNTLRMATMSLFGMLNWYYTWNRGRGLVGRRQYARYAANIFLDGVAKPDRSKLYQKR